MKEEEKEKGKKEEEVGREEGQRAAYIEAI